MILGIPGGLQIGLILLLAIGFLLIAVFFNLTLQKSMAAVSEKNRAIAPGLIWLNFIPVPFLNSIWTMVFGIITCNTMNKDAGEKIAPSALAVVYPSLSIVTSILALIMNASAGYRGPSGGFLLLVVIFSLATFILWIIFWAQLNGAKNKLNSMSLSSSREENLDTGFVDKTAKTSTEKDRLEALREYKALLNDGVITEEEFDKKKKDLLQ